MPLTQLVRSFPLDRSFMHRFLTASAMLLWLINAATLGVREAAAADPPAGLLVMAHGGSPEWNLAIKDAVGPLRGPVPVEIAFGMADRASLQEGVRRLEAQGAERIAVVRLFISGASFKHQTEFFLGLRPDAPAEFIDHAGHGSHDSHAGHDHAGHSHADHGSHAADPRLARTPIERRAELALSAPGLAEDAALLTTVLGERAAALSKQPKKEAVLFLGHGVGDDEENREMIKLLDSVARDIAGKQKFASVRVEGLREDWKDKRAEAEKRIREYVTTNQQKGRQVLVVPVRVYGFGPYKEVLGELSYVSDEQGLLPHAAVTSWITKQYEQVCTAKGWQAAAFGRVDAAATPAGSN